MRWMRDMLKGSLTREELENSMEKGTLITFDFLVLVILSTIVAAIGLLHDDVAVIIGAMVIAPLLGPNLALAFGAALGKTDMIFSAVITNCVGLSLTLLLSIGAGILRL